MVFSRRFGKVQSVKLFGKEKEAKDSVGNVVPTNGISLPEVSATVAFIDIKSANKAHSTKHVLDGRTLKTDYYTPSSSASSSATNVSSHVPEGTTGAGAKTTSVPVADPPLEKEGPPDVDERSHNTGSSAKAAVKRRHSQRYGIIFLALGSRSVFPVNKIGELPLRKELSKGIRSGESSRGGLAECQLFSTQIGKYCRKLAIDFVWPYGWCNLSRARVSRLVFASAGVSS